MKKCLSTTVFLLFFLLISPLTYAGTCKVGDCGTAGGAGYVFLTTTDLYCKLGQICLDAAQCGGPSPCCKWDSLNKYGCKQTDDQKKDPSGCSGYASFMPVFSGMCPPTYTGAGCHRSCAPDGKICCISKSVVKARVAADDKKWVVDDPEYAGPRITTIPQVLTPIARILFYGGLFIGLGAVVLSGYMLMVSEGDPRKTQEAKSQLTAAIVGLLFILLSSAILRTIISSLLGLSY
ncbi:hypothetical protein ACFL15_01600 [Patescibacteria group bacterium]